MSLSVYEGGKGADYAALDRHRLVSDFENGVIDRMEGDQTETMIVGIGIVLSFDINPNTRRAQLSLNPDFGSQVGFRFDPVRSQGVRRTLVDLTAEDGEEVLGSRMLSTRAIDSLNRLIRNPYKDPISDAKVATVLTDEERGMIERRSLKFQPPKE